MREFLYLCVVRYFMTQYKTILLYLLLGLFVSCNNTRNTDDSENSTQENSESKESYDDNGCKFEDGTHSATVDYYNPETGYSQTYTLDVEVENCEVVQINFPKGGWLDLDHISPAELDENSTCTIDGEEGKTYKVKIDN